MTPPNWIWLHIPLLALSYLMLLGAAGVSAVFIVQERRIKKHEALAVTSSLPPLEAMERFIHRMIVFAFPLLTLGILLGGHWAVFTRQRYWGKDPTEILSVITWLTYAIYLALHKWAGWRGRRSTYLALIGFGVVLATLITLYYFSPLHKIQEALV